MKRTTPRILKLLPDGSVFSDRAASKIRNAERGWRYAANILLKHGATEPLTDDHAALKIWLDHWTTLLTRPLKHPGNHRYAWSLSNSIILPPSHHYPKWPGNTEHPQAKKVINAETNSETTPISPQVQEQIPSK